MESKRKNAYITIFVITTIIASCVAVYFGISENTGKKKIKELEAKVEVLNSTEEENKEEKTDNVEIKETEKIVEKAVFPKLDISKWLNNNKKANDDGEIKENVSSELLGIRCSLNKDKKSASIFCEPSVIKKMYNIDNGSTYLNINVTGFSGEILDILVDSIGEHQAVGGEVILFLMSDGTVEYVPLEKALKNGGNNIKSYGKVQGVSDIVRLSTVRIANIYNGETVGGHANPVAIKADGSFYDVGNILHDIVWE